MNRFLAILKNEYRIDFYLFYIPLAILVLFYIFLLTRIGAWPAGIPTGVSLMPLFCFAIAAVVSSLTSFGDEYKHGTIYTLLSLPVRGYTVIGAKFLLIFLAFTIYILVMLAGILLILNRDIIARMAQMQVVYTQQLWDAIMYDSFHIFIIGIGILVFVIITGIFAYTVYRSVDIPYVRFITAFMAYILPGYAAQKLSDLTMDILPPIWMNFKGISATGSVFSLGSFSVSLTPGIFYAAMAIIMFFASSWLYENRMEVIA